MAHGCHGTRDGGVAGTVRGRVPVAAAIPAVGDVLAGELVRASGCATAEVVVGSDADGIDRDVARLVAVRAALGAGGSIRCRADGRWDVTTATAAIGAFVDAVGDLEFVEQPCRTPAELGKLRRRVTVPIAARISAGIPAGVDLKEIADVAVLACGLAGGVRRGLRLAETIDLPCVVSSTAETTIGLAAGVALAGALPALDFACSLGTRALLAGDVVSPVRSLLPRDGRLPVAPMPPAPDPARRPLCHHRPGADRVVAAAGAHGIGMTKDLRIRSRPAGRNGVHLRPPRAGERRVRSHCPASRSGDGRRPGRLSSAA